MLLHSMVRFLVLHLCSSTVYWLDRTAWITLSRKPLWYAAWLIMLVQHLCWLFHFLYSTSHSKCCQYANFVYRLLETTPLSGTMSYLTRWCFHLPALLKQAKKTVDNHPAHFLKFGHFRITFIKFSAKAHRLWVNAKPACQRWVRQSWLKTIFYSFILEAVQNDPVQFDFKMYPPTTFK